MPNRIEAWIAGKRVYPKAFIRLEVEELDHGDDFMIPGLFEFERFDLDCTYSTTDSVRKVLPEGVDFVYTACY